MEVHIKRVRMKTREKRANPVLNETGNPMCRDSRDVEEFNFLLADDNMIF